jgi:septum formation protein
MKNIILASSSPRRKELLKKIYPSFKIMASEYEEDMTLKLEPHELAMFLARGKSQDVSKKVSKSIIIGADTFITFENKVLGKPKNKMDARKILKMLSGKAQKVYTGISVIDQVKNKEINDYDITIVKFKELTDKEIEDYIATGEPLDKAGAYGIQDGGKNFIKEIIGSESNVIGLPLEKLSEILKEIGLEVKKWKKN